MQKKASHRSRTFARMWLGLVLGLGLLFLGLISSDMAQASEPAQGLAQLGGTVSGLASNALECLASGDEPGIGSSGTVHLAWSGQVERAVLVLSVAGAEAGHTIKVNGQSAGAIPIRPGGQPCGAEEYSYLEISPDLVVQGDNLIEIMDDGLSGDAWTAANVRLEVFGELTPVPTKVGIAEVSIASTRILTFTNAYDDSSQLFIAQIPDGYTEGTPIPLLVAVHARNGTKESGLDWFAAEANARTWLLASPEMHGRWPIPPECYVNPLNCDSVEQVLVQKPGAFAYASLESQYDVIGTVRYMVENYDVDPNRIYLAGYSMGGQGGVIIAAKFPHVFAAVFDNKGPTDMATWYDEQVTYYSSTNVAQVLAMRKECHLGGDPKVPADNPFCYERRSGLRFAGNYIHIPISMTHSVSDQIVPIHHSRNLRDAINTFSPDWTASLFEENGGNDGGSTCGFHCYEPDSVDVLDFLGAFTLDNNPQRVRVTSDESKAYYWVNLAQTGGDHWSEVQATAYPVTSTVSVVISDTHPLTVGLNLGPASIVGVAGTAQPGVGLPATTYLVKGGGRYELRNYVSGYLTTSLASTGQFGLTISALSVQVSAVPAVVSVLDHGTSTIDVVARDALNNPVPDGTMVQLTTTEGSFPNASSTIALPSVGGRVTTTLSVSADDTWAEVAAGVGTVTDSVSVDVVHPAIELGVTPGQTTAYSGESILYTYRITNTGDVALSGVTVLDDNGTPGNSADDRTVCSGVSLAASAGTTCQQSAVVTRTTTNTAVARGHDVWGTEVADTDSATVTVLTSTIDLSLAPDQNMTYAGEPVMYTYRITNTSNAVLKSLVAVDDNGTPGDIGDDITVCEKASLGAGKATLCSRSATVLGTTTNTATVTARDPGDAEVSDADAATVTVIAPGIALLVTADRGVLLPGQQVTYSYAITNTGDVLLTSVQVVDDNGTPGNQADDVTVCSGIELAALQTTACERSVSLAQSTTWGALASGVDPLDQVLTSQGEVSVTVGIPVYLPIILRGG